MPERTHIPSTPACGQWETLLADALDGLLRPEDESTFSSHMATCSNCATLFEEARQGREWLEFLSPEPEVPAGLLDKLLAQTGPGQVSGFGLATPMGNVVPAIQPWQRPGFMARIRRFAEPRLLMTAAMAFFSIALTLNLTGVRITKLRLSDLRPTSLRSFMERQFTMIAGLDSMISSSSQGSTSITLQFDLSRDIDGATVDVETAIAEAMPLLRDLRA